MKALALAVMLLAMLVLHPGLMLAAGLVVYLTHGRKRRQTVPRAVLVPRADRRPTRAEELEARFGSLVATDRSTGHSRAVASPALDGKWRLPPRPR